MKPKINLTADDIETTINFSMYQLGERAEVYTTDKVIMKRYNKFMKAHPELCTVVHDDEVSMIFSVDARCASIYPRAPRKGRQQTEEEKALARERFAEARKNKTK